MTTSNKNGKHGFAKLLGVTLLIAHLFPNTSFSQDIRSEAVQIGEDEFYSGEIVDLVFGGESDYRKIFNCQSILLERNNNKGGIDSSCVVDGDVLLISTSMGPEGRLESAYICPVDQSPRTVERLIGLSFESSKLSNGTLYNLGYTDGWRRDYINRLAVLTIEGQRIGCWDIGRR